MNTKKLLPVLISYAVAVIVFIILLFVNNENNISIIEAVFGEQGGDEVLFSRMLTSIIIIVTVLAMVVVGAVIAIRYFTKKEEARKTAHQAVYAMTLATAFIGITASLRGIPFNNYMVMELPTFMTYIILGNAAILACGISGFIMSGTERKVRMLVPRLTSIVLYAAAFAVACTVTTDGIYVSEDSETLIKTVRCIFMAWTCLRMTMQVQSASLSFSAFPGAGGLHAKLKIKNANEYVSVINYLVDIVVCVVFYIVMLSLLAKPGSAGAQPVIICFIVLTVLCMAAVIFTVTIAGRSITAFRGKSSFIVKVTLSVYAFALSVCGIICAAAQPALTLLVTYAFLITAASASLAVALVYNDRYAERPMDQDTIIKIMAEFPPYFALRSIDTEAAAQNKQTYERADFAEMCDRVRATAFDLGCGISADGAAAVVAGMISSRVSYFIGDGADSAVCALGSIFGEGTSGISGNTLFGVGQGADFKLSAFMDTFYRSARYPDELRAVTLTGVGSLNDSPLLYNIKPEYGSHDTGFVRLGDGVPDKLDCVRAGKIKVGRNVRFAFAMREQSYLSKEMLESTAMINIEASGEKRPIVSPSRMRITMSDLSAGADDARRKYRLTDAEQRNVASLLALLSNMGIRYENDIVSRFEIYTSVYRACGGSAEKAIDSAVAALILPCIFFADRSATAYSPAEAVNAFGFPMPESMRMLRLADFTGER